MRTLRHLAADEVTFIATCLLTGYPLTIVTSLDDLDYDSLVRIRKAVTRAEHAHAEHRAADRSDVWWRGTEAA